MTLPPSDTPSGPRRQPKSRWPQIARRLDLGWTHTAATQCCHSTADMARKRICAVGKWRGHYQLLRVVNRCRNNAKWCTAHSRGRVLAPRFGYSLQDQRRPIFSPLKYEGQSQAAGILYACRTSQFIICLARHKTCRRFMLYLLDYRCPL